MDLKAALRELESKGKLSARKAYARHGVTGSCFGVGYADLGAMSRAIKVDHALALQLWGSGNHDARVLATMIVDPAQLDEATALAWLEDVDNYVLDDAISEVIARMPAGLSLARRLIDSEEQWPSAAGWNALARLALATDDSPAGEASGRLDDAIAAQLLARVERTIQGAPNRTRYSMNGFVIAVGSARDALRERALEASRAIGVVQVDHGETGCKTPDAATAIAKSVAHERAKVAKAAKQAKAKRR
jgi:hypothetical protein